MALSVAVARRTSRAPQPAAQAPRTWGGYRERYLVGLALVVGGAALVAQTSAFTLSVGLLGSALHVAGWLVEPGRLRTRMLVAGPAALLCWGSLGGASGMWLLAGLLPCWLAVRERPRVTLLLTAVPAGVGLALGGALPYVADKSVVFCGVVGAVALCALLAQELALRVDVRLIHGDRIAAGRAAADPSPVD